MTSTKNRNLIHKAIVILASLGFLMSLLSIVQHPLIGDDRHFIWWLSEQGSVINFIKDYYYNWGGNILHTILWSFFSLNSISLFIYKIVLVPTFILMSCLSYYLATNEFPDPKSDSFIDFIVFTSILWLAIPDLGQTIAWVTGSVYLWMTTLALLLLTLMNHARKKIIAGITLNYGLISYIFILIFSFLIGTSSIQLFCSIILIIAYWVCTLKNHHLLDKIPFIAYVCLFGLILGFIALASSPGNFERLATSENSGLLSVFLKYSMYLAGAYFSGGSENLGIPLILGSLIILLIGKVKAKKEIISKSSIWFMASFASLLPMILAVNLTSPRTTFMATVFMLIGIKSLINHQNKSNQSVLTHGLVPILCCLLVIVDSFVGWSSNKSLDREINNRMSIINMSLKEDKTDIVVPYLTTISSRQTYMMTPDQDQQYLSMMAKHYGVNSMTHDKSDGAPKPNTRNPLKALREIL